jgi:hypothetical protein
MLNTRHICIRLFRRGSSRGNDTAQDGCFTCGSPHHKIENPFILCWPCLCPLRQASMHLCQLISSDVSPSISLSAPRPHSPRCQPSIHREEKTRDPVWEGGRGATSPSHALQAFLPYRCERLRSLHESPSYTSRRVWDRYRFSESY